MAKPTFLEQLAKVEKDLPSQVVTQLKASTDDDERKAWLTMLINTLQQQTLSADWLYSTLNESTNETILVFSDQNTH